MAQALTVKVYGRMDRLNIFTPYVSPEYPNNPPKFRGNLILDPKTARGKESIEKLEAATKQIGMEAWKKWPQPFANDVRRFFYFDGDSNTREVKNSKGEMEDVIRDGYAGMKFIKASSANAPVIRDSDGKTDLKASDNKPYNGCEGWFVINIKDTDKGGRGMFAYMEAVQFVKHGDPLGGSRINPNDYMSNESEEDDDL